MVIPEKSLVVIVDLPLIRTCKWTCYHIYEPGQSFDKTSNDEYFGPNLNADFIIISIIWFYKLPCFCVLIASDFYITRSKIYFNKIKKVMRYAQLGLLSDLNSIQTLFHSRTKTFSRDFCNKQLLFRILSSIFFYGNA